MLNQISAQKGAVLGSGCWQCQPGPERNLCQHADGGEFFGVTAEEELAKCSLLVPQDLHGQALQVILESRSTCQSGCLQLLSQWCVYHKLNMNIAMISQRLMQADRLCRSCWTIHWLSV